LSSAHIAHFGTLQFEGGAYKRVAGSEGWTAQPISGFGLEIGPPLGQILVKFHQPLATPYTVVVTALRLPNTPSLVVNYGNVDPSSFVVHLFDPIGSRTLQNGGFSFAVLTLAE
jgi:hypothetical protein